jgi:hypothetical protein
MPRLRDSATPVSAPPREEAFLGIDPGASGGLAYIWGTVVLVRPMPATERDLWELVCDWGGVVRRQGGIAVLEQVGGYVKGAEGRTTKGGTVREAGAGANGAAMFKFGSNYGLCRMALTAAGVPWELATPNTWQARTGVPVGSKKEKAQHKNAIKARAQALFPGVAVTLKTADALLIAEYARRKFTQVGRETSVGYAIM